MLWEKVIVEESGWCWWWLVPAAEPPGSTVTLEWALRRTVPATAVSDLSMHNCLPMHKSHCADAHWTINIAVSMLEVVEHWGSFLLHLPTKVEEGNAKWQRRSSLLSTSHLLSGRRACTYLAQIESANSCVHCAILSTSGCCHIFSETCTTPSVFLCCYWLFIILINSSQAFISALFNIC